MIVLDASVVGPMALPDEAQLGDAITTELMQSAIMVPSHWHLEVASMIRSAIRRGRVDPARRPVIFERVARLSVQTDLTTHSHAWTTTLSLSDRLGLTPYDAAYIELATRCGARLATFDKALIAAAAVVSIPLVALTP